MTSFAFHRIRPTAATITRFFSAHGIWMLCFCLWASPASAAVSLEEMAGQMIMMGFRGTGNMPLSRDLANLLTDIDKGRIGGVILFERDSLTKQPGRNIVSLNQVRRLTAMLQQKAHFPLFVGVDQEGGRVRRFRPEHGVPDMPSAAAMGRGTPQATRELARDLGEKLAAAGVNLDFAPALDVDVNPQSPAIGALGRSFSSDAETVTLHGKAFAQGLWDKGIVACYKHFPGHGSATDDTHAGLADITRTFRQKELLPYKRLLARSAPVMVMMGHLAHTNMDADLPASLSRAVVTGLLRRELGWRGVVITDDLQMRAIRDHYSQAEAFALAVNAGVDILLVGNNLAHDAEAGRKAHALLLRLVKEGRIPKERIEESFHRIMELKGMWDTGGKAL